MKKFLLIITLICTFALFPSRANEPETEALQLPQSEAVDDDCGCEEVTVYNEDFLQSLSYDSAIIGDADADAQVYICTGNSAYAYHKHSSCKSLKRCRSAIIKVSRVEALKMGRSACKKCY